MEIYLGEKCLQPSISRFNSTVAIVDFHTVNTTTCRSRDTFHPPLEWGRPGNFSHMSDVKGRKGVEGLYLCEHLQHDNLWQFAHAFV